MLQQGPSFFKLILICVDPAFSGKKFITGMVFCSLFIFKFCLAIPNVLMKILYRLLSVLISNISIFSGSIICSSCRLSGTLLYNPRVLYECRKIDETILRSECFEDALNTLIKKLLRRLEVRVCERGKVYKAFRLFTILSEHVENLLFFKRFSHNFDCFFDFLSVLGDKSRCRGWSESPV